MMSVLHIKEKKQIFIGRQGAGKAGSYSRKGTGLTKAANCSSKAVATCMSNSSKVVSAPGVVSFTIYEVAPRRKDRETCRWQLEQGCMGSGWGELHNRGSSPKKDREVQHNHTLLCMQQSTFHCGSVDRRRGNDDQRRTEDRKMRRSVRFQSAKSKLTSRRPRHA